jgi:predicted phosphodiesterase
MDDKRIIVFSDIHANINAYKAALKQARQIGFDHLINLGDLLTYGCDTTEIIDTTNNAVEIDKMILIKGNHDQLYFDLMRSDYSYYNTLPDWIQDSINWTIDNTCLDNFENNYNWLNYYNLDNIYFAHANPFEYGNWSYLNSNEKYIEAAENLSRQHKAIGIFGHTHRQNISLISDNYVCTSIPEQNTFNKTYLLTQLALIINLDSIGQPRNSNKLSTLLVLDIKENQLDLEFVKIPYDLGKHKESIRNALFSKGTQKKLFSFFNVI